MVKNKFEVDISYSSPGNSATRKKVIVEQDSPNWNSTSQSGVMKDWVMNHIDKKFTNVNVHSAKKL